MTCGSTVDGLQKTQLRASNAVEYILFISPLFLLKIDILMAQKPMIHPSCASHTLQRVWLARLGLPLALYCKSPYCLYTDCILQDTRTDLMNNDVFCWVLFSMCN